MNWLDILIILSIIGYVWGGFAAGLIHAIGSLVGMFVGIIVAARTYDQFGNVLEPTFGGNGVFADIAAFILLFLIVSRLIGVAFYFVNKMYNLIAIVPGMKLLNKIGGAVFGLIEGGLFAGITLQFMTRLPISTPLSAAIDDSALAQWSLSIAAWLVPLFPAALKDAENTINQLLPK
jgi:uncharacterized membrane protein required for colicin V production